MPDLCAPFWGVRCARPPTTVADYCMAFAPRMPARAFYSSVTAAHLWGMPLPLPLPPLPLHIAVPPEARAVHAARVCGHRLRVNPGDVVERAGVRVLSPARTWCDLAAVLPLADLVAAGDHLVSEARRLCTVHEISTTLHGVTRLRGAATARHALELLDGRAESAPESRLRVALSVAGFPKPHVNVPLRTVEGVFVARPDLRFADYGVCVEYEGDGHRVSRTQWRRDVERTRHLEILGERVFRVTGADLPSFSRALADLNRLLRSRGWPGPPA